MHVTYRYKLKVNGEQGKVLGCFLRLSRDLYNAGMEERIDCYRKTGKGLTKFDQQKSLTALRGMKPDYGRENLQWQRGALTRLDRAFAGFFRRARSGRKPGFPKFKGVRDWRSLVFPEGRGYRICGNRFVIPGGRGGHGEVALGMRMHRPLPDDVLKHCGAVVKRDACGDWWVCLAMEVADVPKVPVNKAIGVDVGLEKFLVDSDGEEIANPRHLRKAEKELARRQRKLSRAKKGSKGRMKKRVALAKWHRKIARMRRDFHYKLARALCRKAEVVAVEDLNVKGLAMSGLRGMGKSVHDAGWFQFIGILSWVAVKTGREVVKVDARGTSRRCSGCGGEVRKELSVRVHECPDCGLVLDRDLNAAINILEGAGFAPAARLPSGRRKTTEVRECPVVAKRMGWHGVNLYT